MNKRNIILEDGGNAVASCPVIVSASRSTDIPAFYADWFFHRLQVGYSVWTNPFSKVRSYVSYKDTRFIIFWSKNPSARKGHRVLYTIHIKRLRTRTLGNRCSSIGGAHRHVQETGHTFRQESRDMAFRPHAAHGKPLLGRLA